MKFDPLKLQIRRFREDEPKTNRRKSILKYVLAGHGIIIFLPLIFWGLACLVEKAESKPETVVVMLSNPAKAKIVKTPKLRPPKAPAKKKPKSKPEPKPTPKPAAPKPAAPKISPATAKTTKKSTITKPKQEPPATESKPSPKPQDDNSDLKVVTPKEKAQPPAPPAPDDQSDEAEADYISVLVSTLYEQWTVPNDELINGRKLEVFVTFTINAAGRIARWEITKSSGFRPLDNSVRNLMLHAQALPKPISGKEQTYEVIFMPEEE